MKRAWLTEAARYALLRLAEQSAPLETGGILVGVVRNGDPWIVMVVEVEDPSRGRSRFMIPERVTPAAVEAARQIDARFGYIGDWHSHPADLPVSDTDKGTLRKSAKRPRRSKQPVLLIVVRAAADGWDVEAFADAGTGAEPLELVLTGELPPPEEKGNPELGEGTRADRRR